MNLAFPLKAELLNWYFRSQLAANDEFFKAPQGINQVPLNIGKTVVAARGAMLYSFKM